MDVQTSSALAILEYIRLGQEASSRVWKSDGFRTVVRTVAGLDPDAFGIVVRWIGELLSHDSCQDLFTLIMALLGNMDGKVPQQALVC